MTHSGVSSKVVQDIPISVHYRGGDFARVECMHVRARKRNFACTLLLFGIKITNQRIIEECHDSDEYSDSWEGWASEGYCDTGDYTAAFMAANCPASCGLCTGECFRVPIKPGVSLLYGRDRIPLTGQASR